MSKDAGDSLIKNWLHDIHPAVGILPPNLHPFCFPHDFLLEGNNILGY